MTKNFVVDGITKIDGDIKKCRYFEAGEIGTFYRLNDGVLEWQPMSHREIDLPQEEDWGAVDIELVGDETVVYNSTEMTLAEVYEEVIERLQNA